MSSTTLESDSHVKYGNLRRVGQAGVIGFGAAASIIGFVGLILILVAMMIGGLKAGGVMLLLVVVGLIPSRRARSDGRTRYERWATKLMNKSRAWAGRDVLLQGPAGFVPDGKCRLPGILAASQLRTCHDAYGAEFGMLSIPSTGHYTVAVECSATGQDLIGLDEHNRQVAQWGAFLAMMGEQRDVVGMQAIVETAPDTGMRLRDAITSQRVESAPPFAVEVGDAQMATYSVGEASIRTWVTITFSSSLAQAEGKKRLTPAEMETRIGNLIPLVIGQLRVSGGGMAARMMTAADLTDTVRVAFDPAVSLEVEQARREEGGTGLTWEEAGPVRLRPFDNALQHDRSWSRSWQMTEPASGTFGSKQLAGLLAPHPDIPRKRVAIVYRPYNAMQAAQVVEADVNQTRFVASQKSRMTARQQRDIAAAERTAEAEAQGAGIVRFGVIITATADTPEALNHAGAVVSQLAGPARLRLRESLGNQEVAFTASLPCGLVLPHYTQLPAELREYL